MKLVTILLVNFFVALSVYAGLQWRPYNPQGDYDGNVLVVGDEVVTMGQQEESGGGICRTLDEDGTIRVGKVVKIRRFRSGDRVITMCGYGTSLHLNDVTDSRRHVLYHYIWDETNKFEVLVAPSHKHYSWFFSVNLDRFELDDRFGGMTTIFNANDDINSSNPNSSPVVHICRYATASWRKRTIYNVGQYFGKGVSWHNGCYYYRQYSFSGPTGRKGVAHQILVEHSLILGR